MAAGSAAAHAAGRLFAPAAAEGSIARETAERAVVGRHTAAADLPLVAGIVVSLVLFALCHVAWTRARGGWRGRVPAGWFAVLPPLAYVIQELVERSLHAENFLFNPATEPRFLLALALQVPFGLLAFAMARMLVAAAERIAEVLRGTRDLRESARARAVRWLATVFGPRTHLALASGTSERGPPFPS